ncbi:conserved hypothetical protein [Parafrankia sp. Ea1.12]|nr:conserved hypothetical protein [Parafrankia sp. Ea1.12]
MRTTPVGTHQNRHRHVPGARRVGGCAWGVAPWTTTVLTELEPGTLASETDVASTTPGRSPIEVTAIPCRHGPPLIRPVVGHVIGFVLRRAGQKHGVLWISGEAFLYRAVREVGDG